MYFPFWENLTRLIVGVNGIIPLQRLYDDVSGSIVKVPVCAAQCYSSGDLKITMLELHWPTPKWSIKRLEFFGALLTVSLWPQHSQKSLLPRGRWERFLYWQGKQQGHSLHQLAVVVKQRVICNCSWKTTRHHLVYLPSNGLQHSGQPWRTVKRHPVVPIHHQCNTGLLCWRAVLWNTIEVGFNPS